MKENIAKVIKKNLCTKCGFCYAICPESAIHIDFTHKGYVVNTDDNCISCGLCNEVCSGKEIVNYKAKDSRTKHNYYFGSYKRIFSIFSNDFNTRYNGSSGGVVSEILIYLLEKKLVEGAVVTTFDKKNPLKPEVFIGKNREEVLSAQGSKYSPVPLGKAFKEVKRDKKYVVVGTPCHLQALVKYINLKKYNAENFFKIGLFCSKTNELKATKILLKLNKVKEKNVVHIKYRGNGHPGKFQIDLENGDTKYIYHLDRTYWGNLFKNFYMPYRCWLCADKTSICSDISVGDDWSRSFYADKVGHSLTIVRTHRGLDLIKDMIAKKVIDGQVVNDESVVISQGLKYKLNIRNRLKIVDFFRKSKPKYVDYDFREEEISFKDEIIMFFKICMINSFLLNVIIDSSLTYMKVLAWFKTAKKCFTVISESVALILLKTR